MIEFCEACDSHNVQATDRGTTECLDCGNVHFGIGEIWISDKPSQELDTDEDQ